MVKKEKKGFIKELIPYLVIIIVVVIIRSFIVTPVRVNGDSMKPNLYDKEILILNKITMNFNELKRFDIVVIDYKSENSHLVKRVIGLPGETIKYEDGKLYINDKIIKDPYFKDNNTDDFSSITIPKGYYFVLGDNRSISKDSRIIGLISKKDILGTTSFRLYPFNKIGKI